MIAAPAVRLPLTLAIGAAVGCRAVFLPIVAEFLLGAWALTHVKEQARRPVAAPPITAGARA